MKEKFKAMPQILTLITYALIIAIPKNVLWENETIETMPTFIGLIYSFILNLIVLIGLEKIYTDIFKSLQDEKK